MKIPRQENSSIAILDNCIRVIIVVMFTDNYCCIIVIFTVISVDLFYPTNR